MPPETASLLDEIKTDYPAVVAAILMMPDTEAGQLLSAFLSDLQPASEGTDPLEQLAISLGTAAGLTADDCQLAPTLTSEQEDRWESLYPAVR